MNAGESKFHSIYGVVKIESGIVNESNKIKVIDESGVAHEVETSSLTSIIND